MRLKLLMAALMSGMLIPVVSPVSAAQPSEETTENASVTVPDRDTPKSKVLASESNEQTYLLLEDQFFTAERIPTDRWDTPANVTVITAQEIEDNHYQDIAEALNHVNGVIVYSNGATFSQVLINGDGRVLLLIDGKRANNSQNTTFVNEKSDLSMLPTMKMVERIEILKGGSSALYGSDAVGGVINIITKRGSGNETSVDLNTGSWNRHNYEITNQGSEGDFSWFLTGGLHKSRPYEYRGTYQGEGVNTYDTTLGRATDYDDNDAAIRLDQRFSDRDSLTLDGMHRTHHYYNDRGSVLYNSLSLSYNYKEGSSTPGWLRYYNNYKSSLLQNVERLNDRLQGVEYQNGWEFGQHKLITGAEYQSSKASNEFNGYDDRKMNNRAVYLQDTISLGDKWKLVPGVRYDNSSDYDAQWSPKAAVNYRADDKTKFYASWGRVFRTPSMAELYLVDNGTFYYGNKYVLAHGGEMKIHPEKGHTETIGIEHDFDDNTGIGLNLFNTKVDDALFWNPVPVPFYDVNGQYLQTIGGLIIANGSDQTRRGVETSFRQRINDNLSYNLGYSHTYVKDSRQINKYAQPNGYRVGLHYKNRELKLNLLSFLASGLDEQYYSSSTYGVLDFNASYDINDTATIYFKANNFTDQKYSHTGKTYFAPGRYVGGGVDLKF